MKSVKPNTRLKYALEEEVRRKEEELEEMWAWREVYQYMAAFGLPTTKENLQRRLPGIQSSSFTMKSRTAFEQSRIRQTTYVLGVVAVQNKHKFRDSGAFVTPIV